MTSSCTVAENKYACTIPTCSTPQVRRMLADPKAHSLAENFGGPVAADAQSAIPEARPQDLPASTTSSCEDAMRTETEMFFQSIVTDDRSVLDFLDGTLHVPQ